MRTLIVQTKAEKSIYKVASFIESKNLSGSSDKWVNEIFSLFNEHTKLSIVYPLCKSRRLAKQKLSCIIFKKKWVIAFKVTENNFTVYQVLNGRNLR